MNTTRFKIISYLLTLAFSNVALSSCSQISTNLNDSTKKVIPLKIEKMKVEIWSDVMCPFCYIGKRKFEIALGEFENKENIEIVWKSFQLNEDLKTDTSKNTVQHLAETKGWTMDYTRNTIKYVMEMASGVGLKYDFDKAVVANSFDAHRFIQFAKTKGKGDAAEEVLFKAYFTEGKNTADHTILIQLAKDIGLDSEAVKVMLSSAEFTTEVNRDVAEAQQIGVTGVPFFVVDRKYAVSGAQDSKVFLETLEKAWKEHAKSSSESLNATSQGSVCTPDGACK